MGSEVGAALGAVWVRLVNSLFAWFKGTSLTKTASELGSTGPGLGAAVLAVWMSRTQTKRFSCKALATGCGSHPEKMSLRRSACYRQARRLQDNGS